MTSADPALGAPAAKTASGTRAVAAAVLGNILEWYDFAIYGYVASIISHTFFPSEDPTTALLATFATFGLGFFARPLGGIVIGRMGDVKGRKAALMLTIMLMALGTVGIGLTPGYDSIGLLAPLLLLVFRLMQGFAAGGEWGGATAFIVESAPANRRGFFGSFQQSSVAFGLLLGSGIAAVCSTVFTDAQMQNWAWRVPFLLGAILIPVGYYMRRNLEEPRAFTEAQKAKEAAPAAARAATPGWKLALKAFCFTVLWTVSYYEILYYMPTFTKQHAGLSATQALWSNTIGLAVLVLVIPLFGRISDSIGRKPLLLLAAVLFAVLTYPLFGVMTSGVSYGTIILIQIVFGLLIALISGPGPAAISEIFPTASRSTWMSTGYSLSVTIFGGFAPFIATWLIATTGSPMSPTFYLIIAAVISGVTIWRLEESAHRALH